MAFQGRQLTRAEFLRQYNPEKYQKEVSLGLIQPVADDVGAAQIPRSPGQGINTSATGNLSAVVDANSVRQRSMMGARPQNASVPGLPPPPIQDPLSRRAAEEVADLDELNAIQAADAQNRGRSSYDAPVVRFGPENQGRFFRLGRGSRRDAREIDNQIQLQEEAALLNRQQLLEAGVNRSESPAEVVNRVIGSPVNDALAARTRQFADVMGIPVDKAYSLARREAEAGADPVNFRRLASGGGSMRVPIPQKNVDFIGRAGEISPNPLITDLVNSLNGEILRKRTTGGTLSDEAAGADSNSGLWDATERPPVDVLSEADKAILALNSRSRAEGAQVRPYRTLNASETRDQADASGMPKTRGGRRDPFQKERTTSEVAQTMRVPGNVLAAGMEFDPRNVLVPIVVAPRNQVRSASGEGSQGVDTQVAQFFVRKDAQGRPQYAPSLRDARVLNINPYAEVPDSVMTRLGLDPVAVRPEKDVSGALDARSLNVPVPDITPDGQPVPGFRPEADPAVGSSSLGWRNPTLAEAVRGILLQNSTPIKPVTPDMLQNRGMFDRDVLIGSGIPVYALPGRDGDRRFRFQQPADPNAPPVADVRIGSPMRYTNNAYTQVDELIGALAEEVYGKYSGSWEVPVQDSYRRLVQADDPRAAVPARAPDYGALVNLPANALSDEVRAFQARLLDEAGVPGGDGNQLMRILSYVQEVAGAPPNDVPIRRAALSAAEAEPLLAPPGLTGAARLLQQVKERVFPQAKGLTSPTSETERRVAEGALAFALKQALASDNAAQPRAVPPVQQRLLRNPTRYEQTFMEDVLLPYLGRRTAPPPRAEQYVVHPDTVEYMAQRQGRAAAAPEPVGQYVIPGMWDQVARVNSQGAAEASAALEQASNLPRTAVTNTSRNSQFNAPEPQTYVQGAQLNIPGVGDHSKFAPPAQDDLSRLTEMMRRRAEIERTPPPIVRNSPFVTQGNLPLLSDTSRVTRLQGQAAPSRPATLEELLALRGLRPY